jgi:hypothetical protein
MGQEGPYGPMCPKVRRPIWAHVPKGHFAYMGPCSPLAHEGTRVKAHDGTCAQRAQMGPLGAYGPFGSMGYMGTYRRVGSHGPIWTHVCPYIWATFGPVGHMGPYGPFWPMGPHGPT